MAKNIRVIVLLAVAAAVLAVWAFDRVTNPDAEVVVDIETTTVDRIRSLVIEHFEQEQGTRVAERSTKGSTTESDLTFQIDPTRIELVLAQLDGIGKVVSQEVNIDVADRPASSIGTLQRCLDAAGEQVRGGSLDGARTALDNCNSTASVTGSAAATPSPEDDDIRVLVRIREPAGAPWTMLVAVVILGIAATGLILRRRFRSDAEGTPPPAQAARPANEPRGELN